MWCGILQIIIPVTHLKNKNSDQVSRVEELIAIAPGQWITLNYKGLLNKMLTWLVVLHMETITPDSNKHIFHFKSDKDIQAFIFILISIV
jgi:hypothetical protein